MKKQKHNKHSGKFQKVLLRIWEHMVCITYFLQKHHVPQKIIMITIRAMEIGILILDFLKKLKDLL